MLWRLARDSGVGGRGREIALSTSRARLWSSTRGRPAADAPHRTPTRSFHLFFLADRTRRRELIIRSPEAARATSGPSVGIAGCGVDNSGLVWFGLVYKLRPME